MSGSRAGMESTDGPEMNASDGQVVVKLRRQSVAKPAPRAVENATVQQRNAFLSSIPQSRLCLLPLNSQFTQFFLKALAMKSDGRGGLRDISLVLTQLAFDECDFKLPPRFAIIL
jgi:hypothetical protein